MRWAISALFGAVLLTACGQHAPNTFPESARQQFEASCPPDSAVCACTWDELTRTLTYEEYEAALERFRTEGIMDPRVTHARTVCIERHPEH